MTYQDKLKKFTFLIPIFDLKDDRFNNFKFVLSKIKEVTDRILVVEQVRDDQATQSKQFTESLGIDYFSVKINDDFIHKSKLINLGTDKINTGHIWVNDADCYLKFQKVIDLLDFKHNFIQPYNVGKYIEKTETDKIIKGEAVDIEFNYSKLHEEGQHIVPGTLYYTAMYGALSFIYSKQSFKAIGKMNEMYAGWGLEDNSLCMRMLQYKNLKLDIVNLPGIHLYHPRGNYAEKLSCKRTTRNILIYEEEFSKKVDDLHALTRLYYERYYENSKIGIIGIGRSGTTLLQIALSIFLNLPEISEPFGGGTFINTTADGNKAVDSIYVYANRIFQKNKFILKHICIDDSFAAKFGCDGEYFKKYTSDRVISECKKIIFTTRHNFLDWLVSVTLASATENWATKEYSIDKKIIITKSDFLGHYTLWKTYHYDTLPAMINACAEQNKKYKIIDYDDYTGCGDMNDFGIGISYQEILKTCCIKKQKTHRNQQYIENYDELLSWVNSVKNSL
jgi:hypothetical protein